MPLKVVAGPTSPEEAVAYFRTELAPKALSAKPKPEQTAPVDQLAFWPVKK